MRSGQTGSRECVVDIEKYEDVAFWSLVEWKDRHGELMTEMEWYQVFK